MGDEIGEGHFSGEHEGDRAGEEPDQNQRTADDLQASGEAEQRLQVDSSTANWGEAEDLRRPAEDVEQRGHDTQDAEQPRRRPGHQAPGYRGTYRSSAFWDRGGESSETRRPESGRSEIAIERVDEFEQSIEDRAGDLREHLPGDEDPEQREDRARREPTDDAGGALGKNPAEHRRPVQRRERQDVEDEEEHD